MDAHEVTVIIHPPCSQLPLKENKKISTFEFLWNIDEAKFSPVLANHQCSFYDSVLEDKNKVAETVLICDYGITADSLSISCILLMFKFKWTLIKTLFLMQKAFPLMRALQINTKSLILYDRFISSFSKRSKSLVFQKDIEISENAELTKNTFLNISVKKKQSIRISSSEVKRKKVEFNVRDNKQISTLVYSSLPTQFSRKERKEEILTVDSEPERFREFSIIKGKGVLRRVRTQSNSSEILKERIYRSQNEKRGEEKKVERYGIEGTECRFENETLTKIQNKIKEKFSFTTFVHSNRKKLNMSK